MVHEQTTPGVQTEPNQRNAISVKGRVHQMQQDEAYSICVIGPFRIFAPDGNAIETKNARAAALLAILAMKDDFVAERIELYNLL